MTMKMTQLIKLRKDLRLSRLLENHIKESFSKRQAKPNEVFFEIRNCPLCHGNITSSVEHPLSTIDVVKCHFCGLVYIKSVPSTLLLQETYSDIKYRHSRDSDANDYFGYKSDEEALKAEKIRFINIQKMTGISTGSFLDIGAGFGYLVKAAIALGWKACGIEFDPARVKEAKKRLNVSLEPTRIEDFGLDRKFDLITLNSVLEHLMDPISVLSACAERLRDKESYIFVLVPNHASLSCRLFPRIHRFWQPMHLQYYTPRTLYKTAIKSGLKVRRIYTSSIPKVISNPLKSTIIDKYDFYNEVVNFGYNFPLSYSSSITDRGIKVIEQGMQIVLSKTTKFLGDDLCIILSK